MGCQIQLAVEVRPRIGPVFHICRCQLCKEELYHTDRACMRSQTCDISILVTTLPALTHGLPQACPSRILFFPAKIRQRCTHMHTLSILTCPTPKCPCRQLHGVPYAEKLMHKLRAGTHAIVARELPPLQRKLFLILNSMRVISTLP